LATNLLGPAAMARIPADRWIDDASAALRDQLIRETTVLVLLRTLSRLHLFGRVVFGTATGETESSTGKPYFIASKLRNEPPPHCPEARTVSPFAAA